MKINKNILHNENRHSELKTMQIKLTSHPGGVSGAFLAFDREKMTTFK